MMTGVSLAEAVGVSSAAITRFEKGEIAPGEKVVLRLASVLRVPPAHFFSEPLSDPKDAVRMRSLSAATKRARESAVVRVDWMRELVAYLAPLVPLPSVDLPDLHQGSDPAALSADEVEDYSTRLRRAWGLRDGPIPDLTALLEGMGIVVGCFSLGADSLDAFGRWTPEAPIIVENTDRRTAVRMRFDIAHELGHMVLHRHVPHTLASRPEIHKLMERQAHRFAGAFIFPAPSFINEIYSITTAALLEPKRRWKLSIQAMVRRALDLGLVSDEQYARAARLLSMHGFRRREPLDDEIAMEVPEQLSARIELLIDQRSFSTEEIEAHTRLDRREIEALASMEPGSLDRPVLRSGGGKLVRLTRREGGA